MVENISEMEKIRETYLKIKTEILYSLEQNPEEAKKMRELLASTERDCFDNGINPNRVHFWYNKIVSSLYEFGKMASDNSECSEYGVIKGLLVLSGCNSTEEEVILKGIEKKKSLESKTTANAI
jgi:hypothetical protein